MRTCIVTIGTRGDVQPYVALGLGLKAAGHDVTIATLEEFKPLVQNYGLQHDTLRGDFLKVARKASDESATRKPGNPLRLIPQYVEMARDTLEDEWSSAHRAELFIYNPAAFGGNHIAEKLGVPSFAAVPAPLYSPTQAFPSPFFPFSNLGPLNKLSHRLFAKLGPILYRKPIGEWRKEVLGLPPAKGETMLRGKPVTKLYAYSEAILPRPADWDESSVVTGYWFLDSPADWQPPPELVNFLRQGPPPVYVGFGSMFMDGGVRKTEIVLNALKLAGRRGILATGWGGLAVSNASDDIFVVDAVPHNWLFPRVAAVVHHGGAGTTGAALRAGRPTIICPFVGDQYFWGRRVKALGVGPSPISQWRLTAERLADGIRCAVDDQAMRQRAAALGKAIRAEDGIGRAIALIHKQLSG
ncbi:MAG: glycosyltransferase [Chloroflexota bacterium]|jgi:sterol 3beta-glucosyltransferase